MVLSDSWRGCGQVDSTAPASNRTLPALRASEAHAGCNSPHDPRPHRHPSEGARAELEANHIWALTTEEPQCIRFLLLL